MCDCKCPHANEWSYNDQSNWPSYRNFYSILRTPININTLNVIQDINKIQIHYSNNQNTHYIPNDKFTEYECLDNSSYLIYDGKKYILEQFHFHNSSENTKNNIYYPLECHFVHSYYDEINLQTNLLVISLLMKVSKINGSDLTHNIVENFDKDVVFDLSQYNKLTNNRYYQFIGTTTTPPFIPNVTWNLFFYDDITNDINFNILEKDYKNYLKFFSNNKSNYLAYDNENRQSQPLQNNFISIKEINLQNNIYNNH